MPSFEVTGGKKLKGEIIPQGAKKRSTANYFGRIADCRKNNH